MKKNKFALALIAAAAGLVLCACATGPAAPGAEPAAAAAAPAAVEPATPVAAKAGPAAPAADASTPVVEVPFVDLDSFDRAMEKALASGAPVQVTFVAPMSPNNIAPRLGRWLNTVQDNGGEVEVKNDQRTRSLSLVTALLDAVYAAWRDMRYRSLVKDVKAEVKVSNNEIRQITFAHKSAGEARN